MSTVIASVNEDSPVKPRLTVFDGARGRRSADRRLSPRVTLTKPIPCFLTGVGPAAIRTLSLKGATLVSSVRPSTGSTCRMRIVYGDVCVDTDALVYRTVLDELFYSAEHGSRIRFLSSVKFDDPSVATLNLVYRILGDHWIDSGDDDTTPVDS